MPSVIQALKGFAERTLGCRIYRNTLPLGADFFADVDKAFGCANFRVVVDAGAHRGETALAFASHFHRAEIYSFEPVAANFQELERNVRGESRIHALPFGLGLSPSEELLYKDPESSRKGSILHRAGPADSGEKVRLDCLDRFCTEHRIGRIDLLKIDTEGYELEVLGGSTDLLRTGRVGLVFCESELVDTKTRFVPLQNLARRLAEWNYKLYAIYDQQAAGGERNVQYINALFARGDLCSLNVNPANFRRTIGALGGRQAR